MANWMLNTSDIWLRPIYDVLHRNFCQESVLRGNKITLQVLKESDKAAQALARAALRHYSVSVRTYETRIPMETYSPIYF